MEAREIRLAVCDDDRAQAEYLRKLVTSWAGSRGHRVIISLYDRAEAFCFAHDEDRGFDILLLDIQMPGQNGVELARKLRKTDEALAIVFITGYPDFIGEGYEVSALHYLLKPVDEKKLFLVLDKAAQRMDKGRKTILFDTPEGSVRLYEDEIVYIEAFSHTVTVKTLSGELTAATAIGVVWEKLDKNAFARCHRSYIAGLSHVKKITKTDVFFDGGGSVPLSRRLYEGTNRAFIDYYRGNKYGADVFSAHAGA